MLGFVKKLFNKKPQPAVVMMRRYQQVYNTPEGKWVIEDILGLCNYSESCIGIDDQATYLKLGAQNVGIEIVQRITADLSKMDEESQKEEEIEDEQEV
jgi:hypothetical protein